MLGMEVPGHHQEQLPQTLIVYLQNTSIQLSSIVKSKQTRIELVTRPDPEQLAVAGGISGVLTTVIMAPGERIKCILQVRVFCNFFWIAGCKSMMNALWALPNPH